jgi:hypothetical protein
VYDFSTTRHSSPNVYRNNSSLILKSILTYNSLLRICTLKTDGIMSSYITFRGKFSSNNTLDGLLSFINPNLSFHFYNKTFLRYYSTLKRNVLSSVLLSHEKRPSLLALRPLMHMITDEYETLAES